MSDSHSGYPPGSPSSSLPQYPGVPADVDSSPPGTALRHFVTVVVGAALSAATWAAWLGWDHTASYDSISGQVEDPYVTLQVTGCLLTLAVLTATLAALTRPVEAAAGSSFGFWVPWTVNAVLGDDSGLSLVGSVMVAIGLAVGTAIAAMVGAGVRRGVEDVQRWRTDRRDAEDGGGRSARP